MKPEDTPPNPKPKYFYLVDGEKFETDESSITGASIKAKLAPEKRGYALYLEGHGGDPDKLVNDGDSVTLEKDKGPRRFYTVPAATFGQ